MRVVETPAKEGSSVSQPCPILGLMSSPTIAPWSADQVTALAPDKQVATAGLKLASPATWSDAGVHEALVWGSASGSGKKPYRVCVDLSGPAGRAGRDPLPLAGRTVLVMGVSRRVGIGHAIACRAADHGASVVAHHYRPHDVA